MSLPFKSMHRSMLRLPLSRLNLSTKPSSNMSPSIRQYSTASRKIITLEEHFISTSVLQSNPAAHRLYDAYPSHLTSRLADLNTIRIQDLDSGHVSLQVLSHGTGIFSVSDCTKGNDDLAAAIHANPSRLAGFAMLPMSDPVAAAAELDRCVTQLGLVGALIDNHQEGQFYDADRFLPVFEKAAQLDVPIYLHPCPASEPMLQHYRGGYPEATAEHLSRSVWGWHAETGHHFLRLYASGLFDKLPGLRIVLGHMGEMLPFQLERIIGGDGIWAGKKERGMREVWTQNVWVTTSGMFALAPLACLLKTTTPDRVLYSVDYPFSTNERGFQFLEEVEKSGLMSEDEFDGFTHKNAEKLLNIKVSK